LTKSSTPDRPNRRDRPGRPQNGLLRPADFFNSLLGLKIYLDEFGPSFEIGSAPVNIKNINYIDILILTIIITGIVIPTFFVQSGTPWNTIQFMYYSLVFSGILTGVVIGKFAESNSNFFIKKFIVLVVLFSTIPTLIGTLVYSYIPSRPPAKISNEELEALKFLRGQPDGVVLTLPFNRDNANKAINNPPRPLYLYESSAYVSALSGKSTFLEDEVNLNITGYDFVNRRNKVDKYLKTNDLSFLLDNKISYLYLVRSQNDILKNPSYATKIFSNNEIELYKVNN